MFYLVLLSTFFLHRSLLQKVYHLFLYVISFYFWIRWKFHISLVFIVIIIQFLKYIEGQFFFFFTCMRKNCVAKNTSVHAIKIIYLLFLTYFQDSYKLNCNLQCLQWWILRNYSDMLYINCISKPTKISLFSSVF